MSAPDTTAEWWTTSDVADFLGLRLGTVSSYRQRRQMPAPDKTLGRTHLWRPQTIIEWQSSRPRVGQDPQLPDDGQHAALAQDSTRWQVHSERTVYDNNWVRLSLVDVEQPDGHRFEHHVVTLGAAAMTAVLDNAGERVLLMWRHRFAADVWNWELPGGLVEAGEEPATTAAREAEEETGYRPQSIQHLVTFEPNVGMVRNPHHVYIAHGADRIGDPTETTEMERMEWIPLGEVPALIAAGKILNSGTLIALLHILASRKA